jgi:hypothetical protein
LSVGNEVGMTSGACADCLAVGAIERSDNG